jgi:hypothetical protein
MTAALAICPSQQFEGGNRIDLRVSANVGLTDSVFLFAYILANGDTAKQEIYQFDIIPGVTSALIGTQFPVDWRAVVFRETRFKIRWIARASASGFRAAIKPSTHLAGFAFSTRSLPSIVPYYAEGNHELPRFDEGMAPDSIPGYSDLTPYGPGVVGKTVGPVPPPDPFDPVGLLDTLLSYTTECKTLGWIAQQTTAEKYLAYFNSVKASLEDSNFTAARNTLKQVLQNVDVDSTSALTSEAYALLRFNTEYLLGQLPLPTELSIDDLIALKHEAQAKGWIGDDNFIKELDNGLENAKKHLVRGDSVNCAKELEKFQVKVRQVYEKTVEDQQKGKRRDKRFVTQEGYAALNDGVRSIIDRLPRKKK